MKKRLNVGLIGCGPMGGSLITAAHALTEICDVRAVCDIDADTAKNVAETVEAEALTDMDELVSRDDLDAVIVGVPQFLHKEAVLKVIAAGKHAFVEKPMALNTDDCQEMIDAAKKSGVKLMVGQVLRYIGPFRFVLEHIGDLGEIFAVRITRSGGGSGDVVPWRKKRATSGGILFEVDVHEIDFMRCCLGNAKSVYTLTNPRENLHGADYPDTMLVSIDFTDGGIAQLAASQADMVGTYRGEILGTKGAVHFDMQHKEIRYSFGEGTKLTTLDMEELAYPDAVGVEIEGFIQAVLESSDVPVPGEDGMAAVEIAQGAMESCESGKIVPMTVRTPVRH